MPFPPQHGVRRLLRSWLIVHYTHVRCASLTSAINRGIRKATSGIDRLGTFRNPRNTAETSRTNTKAHKDIRSQLAPDNTSSSKFGRSAGVHSREHHNPRSIRSRHDPSDVLSSICRTSIHHTINGRLPSSTPRSRFELERVETAGSKSIARAKRDREKRPVKEEIVYEAPPGVPYTTAGSEFLYGTFAVTAALEAERRRLYKLYVWRGEQATGDGYDRSIASLARSRHVPVQHVAGDWDRMLMRMSGQRPHNGYILEASPIPKLPVTALQTIIDVGGDLTVSVGPQSAEDQAMNKTFGASTSEAVIPRIGNKSRYPLLLWLDRITDTGNIGAIVRTARFFGVSAILIPEHGTAPFNPVTIKASAGAAEHLPILTVKKEIDFVRASQKHGWRFYAAVAPDSASTKRQAPHDHGDHIESQALHQAPCVLMVGNEGEGLRPFMQQAADESVSIRGIHGSASGVESLNVSVAAALLMERFLSDVPAFAQTSHVYASKPVPGDVTTF